MQQEVALLYQKISILNFLDAQFKGAIPENIATNASFFDALEGAFNNKISDSVEVDEKVYVNIDNEEEEAIMEPAIEKIKDIVANMPNENEEAIEELLKEIIPSKETSKNDLEEFAASYTENPVFERKQKMEVEEKPKSINDNINSGLQIGLNDRIAFIKQLFNNSTDDYLKVLSQINSMDTFEEAQIFIQSKVRLDYNWAEKETYVDRFLLIIEKSFN